MRLLATRLALALERSLPWRVLGWRGVPILMRLTGGRARHLFPLPIEMIETRDTRDGSPHRRMVMYFHDGERLTLVPGKAGDRHDPFWYANALAHPGVTFAGRPFRAIDVRDPSELERLWALADQAYPPNVVTREVAARHGRTIPLLQLDPR
jgi:hypothetical protein